MTINLFEILQNILNEGVSSNIVNDAIDNKYQVEIKYNEPGSHAIGKRIIEPYAYGISPSGNEVIRAFQYIGDTKRGIPKWKLFRLDRITSWNPTQNKFNLDNKNVVDKFKGDDMGMSNVINYVKLDNNNYDNHQQTNINNRKNNINNINDIHKQQNEYGAKSSTNQNLNTSNNRSRGPVMSNDLNNLIDNNINDNDDNIDMINTKDLNNEVDNNSYNNE